MLIHPWDQADEATWRPWLAARDFGTLAANGPDGAAPTLLPTHFFYEHSSYDGGDEVVLHLARPNPFWDAVAANPRLTLAVTDDYAFIPGTWRAAPDADPDHGVPTSYYTSVHLIGTGTVVDDPAEKAALMTRQYARFQPDSAPGPIVPGEAPFGRMLSSIRFLRLAIDEVRAKAKYDAHKDDALAARVRSGLLDRALPQDRTVAARLDRTGRD
ncbi:FMN-binding negative transcriptional regulator [Streptacidiphilus pinicola]|uniref:FMN-binding negative transcriptional regulator n=1 Tax=Streptacidiphilus pinicola TaxID=2219663 RepID=A0A2X0IGS9_9ACTN|nr:FMN-binding negative transcriptional regulator [Streptacidiphilus pinicola]RAG83757.1 FMN-binding negative transcriptional regulator [Streptacidiphilus pinicola]